MSDKSFGDHQNRNIVKNPLLSTAVTGLSLEDLTHNAVLLPVVPSQGVLPSQDNTSGDQNHTLRNPGQYLHNLPSGDSYTTQKQSIDIFPSPILHLDTKKPEINRVEASVTASKASQKSEDDFDVNEYFARLQGTRYVSAPLNSHVKDEEKQNLETAEENLEEINLNDNEKPVEDVQHSLTADIAQNFSQLPTVLPQVASAVFSSFSNMLSMKSREQTPDDRVVKDPNPEPVRHQQSESIDVPLMGVDNYPAPREVLPPPREPPLVAGTSNFRITTKKKAYAQIPGLSSREGVTTHNMPPTSHSMPPFFTPSGDFTDNSVAPQQKDVWPPEIQNTQPSYSTAVTQTYSYYNPNSYNSNVTQAVTDPIASISAPIDEGNFFKPITEDRNEFSGMLRQANNLNAPQESSAAIIPPPPMFSNLTQRESQSNVGKTILPPSVARRLTSKHQVMSQNIPPMPSFTGNYFVPSAEAETPAQLTQTQQSASTATNIPPIGIVTPKVQESIPNPVLNKEISQGSQKEQQINLSKPPLSEQVVAVPSCVANVNYMPPSIPQSSTNQNIGALRNTDIAFPNETSNILPPPTFFNPNTFQATATLGSLSNPNENAIKPAHSINTSTKQPTQSSFEMFGQLPSAIPTSITESTSASTSTINIAPGFNLPPALPPSNFMPIQPNVPPPSSFVNPVAPQMVPQTQIETMPYAEASKPVPLPPKNVGSQSYRMSKKRPQYYSGPIEGMGAISNNVKPVLPPVGTAPYAQPLLTPNVPPSSIAFPDNTAIPDSTPLPPFDLYKPEGILPPYYDSSNKPYEQYSQPNYATSFDLSRQTTDAYETPKDDQAPGFGLLGSLKSKLSSIDINKLQDKVTTFFDPAFNAAKPETESKDNYAYQSLPLEPSYYGGASQDQTGSFDIYVPDNQKSTQLPPHGYVVGQDSNYSPNAYLQNQMIQNNNLIGNTQTNIGFNSQEVTANIGRSANFQQTLSYGSTMVDNVPAQNINVGGNSTTSDIRTVKPDAIGFRSSNIQEANIHDPTLGTPFPNVGIISKPENVISPVIEPPPITIPKQESLSLASSFFDKNISESQSIPPVLTTDDMQHSFSNLKITQESICVDHYVSPTRIGESRENPDPLKYEFNPFASASFFDHLNTKTNNEIQPETTVSQDDSSVQASKSLYELSTMIAAKAIEDENINDVPEDFITKDLICHLDGCDFAKDMTLTKTSSHLNICETCREVSKLDDKDPRDSEDFTSQLIENITSPIQLLNPVGVPLTEHGASVEVNVRTDNKQLADITHITEETMETIQVQSAVELLDDPAPCVVSQLQYGWNTNNNNIATTLQQDNCFVTGKDPKTNDLFGRSLFSDVPTNASDELKAEFRLTTDDVPSIMCATIPSAPEFEDDAKSDETGGLDVHSIEQDAKKDFPEFDTEEFIIEPSETDDDKIEFRDGRRESSVDNVEEIDSFTNRVERFKKMEEHNMEANENITDTRRASQIFELPMATSPALTIASYFDTGNYAVETHYRNSISSPSNLSSFSVGSPQGSMRIPPGFEEEFKRRLSGLSSTENFTPYLMRSEPNPVVTESVHKVDDIHILPLDKVDFTPPSIIKPPTFQSATEDEEIPVLEHVFESLIGDLEKEEKVVKIPEFSETFGIKPENRVPVNLSVKAEPVKTVKTEPLQDPINFFGSASIPEGEPIQSDDNTSFNRLASYFSSPPKTEPSKPFFELSQSQDHYRHGSTNSDISNKISSPDPNKVKHKINIDPSKNIHNIPHEQYLANLRLMEDLTSYQNIEITNPDQIIRTVNYFNVEYMNSNESLVNFEKHVNKNIVVDNNDVNIAHTHDEEPEKIVESCQYCCDLGVGPETELNRIDFDKISPGDLKFKKNMDQETGQDSSKSDGAKMNVKSDGKPFTINMNEDDLAGSEDSEGMAILNENRISSEYTPVSYHWFYRVDFEGKSAWKGFSVSDSRALEEALHSPDLDENTTVATDGGRFDVNVMGRLRMPVYWSDKPTNVRRCSWFVKGTTSARYVPYTESAADKLEEEYRQGVTTGVWHRRLVLPNNECVVMHGPTVMAHLVNTPQSDAFTQPPQSIMRPRPVHRGWNESEIEDAEPSNIDHLLLLCHGVGSACDMRFRSVEEVVDDFRSTSHQLLQAHYKNSYDNGVVGRVEVLPISWHKTLHTGDKGVDQRLAQITLESIPKLRNFTNDTVLDVLFYTSPVYCQTIIDTVCSELNRIYTLFKRRNPNFTGGVSLGGHSLGSVILYDLLCHQPPVAKEESANKTHINGSVTPGHPNFVYPVLKFVPEAMYAMGSPISIFECIRGVEHLGMNFSLPTCKNFFNIFHPYDPIAYRIEPLINVALKDIKPSLIPHHKGRKRMHLELKDTMARVGADIKQRLIESFKATWASVWKSQPPPSDSTLEKVVEEEIEKGELAEELPTEKPDTTPNVQVTPDMLGRLNHGRRIDHVLQEAPFELINEYIFAMSSHVCYWESEDTMLLILREIYEALGIRPDSTVPQQTMIVERTKMQDDPNGRTEQNPSTSRAT